MLTTWFARNAGAKKCAACSQYLPRNVVEGVKIVRTTTFSPPWEIVHAAVEGAAAISHQGITSIHLPYSGMEISLLCLIKSAIGGA
jgi:hypothetical protein